jgi:pilus assembly protein Flp/PilA
MLATYVRATTFLARLRSDERGVTAVEYGIMAAAVAGVVYVAANAIGTQLNIVFGTAKTALGG